eukprot:2551506-Pleurochrysis_carterae.AAC.1
MSSCALRVKMLATGLNLTVVYSRCCVRCDFATQSNHMELRLCLVPSKRPACPCQVDPRVKFALEHTPPAPRPIPTRAYVPRSSRAWLARRSASRRSCEMRWATIPS